MLHVVFDGPPGPEAGRFVEVETPEGKGVRAGEWIDRKDGYWALALPVVQWWPAATLPTRPGSRAIVDDERFGVGEALLFDNGKWGLASFNGQIIEAIPKRWTTVPAPPAE